MFQNVYDYVEELKSDVRYTREFLNKIRGARTRLVNKIEFVKKEINLLKRPKPYIDRITPALKRESLRYAKNRLEQGIVWAASTNEEFFSPVYLEPLKKAARSNDTFNFIFRGTSWESFPIVRIDLNKSAGRLNMWASGIEAYRKQLKIKIPSANSKAYNKRALAASRAWAKIYESRGAKFTRTIKSRISLSGAKAPYWQILDSGTPPSLASDRGGYPTPENEPTHFVEDARNNINEYAKDLLKDQKAIFDSYIESINPAIQEATAILLEVENIIHNIKLGIQENKSVEAKLGKLMQYVDKNKLDAALDKIRKGILVSGTVDISLKGAGRRVRPSVQRLIGYLGE